MQLELWDKYTGKKVKKASFLKVTEWKTAHHAVGNLIARKIIEYLSLPDEVKWTPVDGAIQKNHPI